MSYLLIDYEVVGMWLCSQAPSLSCCSLRGGPHLHNPHVPTTPIILLAVLFIFVVGFSCEECSLVRPWEPPCSPRNMQGQGLEEPWVGFGGGGALVVGSVSLWRRLLASRL